MIIKKQHGKMLLLALGLAVLSGCSGLKTYPNEAPVNMHVQTKTDNDSIFSSIDAVLHIYQMSASCEANYLGTVELDKSTVDVGLPVGKLTYLSFKFVRSGFLGSSSSSIGLDTLLKPKAGAQYQVDLNYVDDLYDMEITEQAPKSRKRKLPIVPFEACKAGK